MFIDRIDRAYIVAGATLLMLIIAVFVVPLSQQPTVLGEWYSTESLTQTVIRPDGTASWLGFEGTYRYDAQTGTFSFTPRVPTIGNLPTRYRIDELTRDIWVLERLPLQASPDFLAFGRNPQPVELPIQAD